MAAEGQQWGQGSPSLGLLWVSLIVRTLGKSLNVESFGWSGHDLPLAWIDGHFFFLARPRGMWDLSFLTRDQTTPPALAVWSPNHWTAGQVPECISCIPGSGLSRNIFCLFGFCFLFFNSMNPHRSQPRNIVLGKRTLLIGQALG